MGDTRRTGPLRFWLFASILVAGMVEAQAEVRPNVPPPGFRALFNGKNLDGWKGWVANPPERARMSRRELALRQVRADREMGAHWRVEQGVLCFDGRGRNLSTEKDFGDFELLVDWKIPPGGDSGIYLRGSPEVQIWDCEEGSGGLYNNKEHARNPRVKADRPPGEWNRFRILMKGCRVTVHLNGVLVVDGVMMENYWERDRPVYPWGPVELQSHGGPLWFRNIFIREIPRARSALGFVEQVDPWTKTKGLAAFLAREGIPARDLTDSFRSGKVGLSGVDALLIGSFATADPALRRGLAAQAEAIRAFVLQGGVVAAFTQADQEQAEPAWLPPSLRARRCDGDHGTCLRLDPGNPLFNGPEKIDETLLGRCAFPGKPPAWETFAEYRGFAPLAASDRQGHDPFILEGAAGEGRVLLFAMCPDKAYGTNVPASKAAARALLLNVVAYARALPGGCLPAVEAKERAAPAVIHASGLVYADANGNGRRDPAEGGIAGVPVSNELEFTRTDEAGRFDLEMPLGKTQCLFPVIPGAYRVTGNMYAYIPDTVRGDRRVEFGLVPRKGPPPRSFTFIQTTDIHVGLLTLADLAEDVAEINRVVPPPDLVFATGDLVDRGSEEDLYRGYGAAMGGLRVPLVNVIGNHDYNGGARRTRNFERFLGPRYFSFDFGAWHVLCLDSTAFDDAQQAWMEQDLAMIPPDRPVLVFQHHLPAGTQLDLFVRHGVKAVFSGHWHGTREARYKGMLDINSAPLRFGGIDRSPRGFRVVHVEEDRFRFDYRVGGVEDHLAVVWPAPGVEVPPGEMPILVSAYDTAVPFRAVEVRIRATDAAQGKGRVFPLEAHGAWSWSGRVKMDQPGDRLLHVEARNAAGQSFQAFTSFRVTPEAFPPAPDPSGTFHGFRMDPGNHGYVEADLRLPLSPAWTAPAGGTVNLASPVVAKGRVYQAVSFLHGFEECGVACFDGRTGRRLWFAPVESSVKHSPCVCAGRVFAVTVTGTLYALDARNGEEVWRASLGGDPAQAWQTCAPVCAGGVVYAGRGGVFSAFDAASGRRRWKSEKPLDGDWWPDIYAAPAAGGGRVFLGSQRGFFALDAATGRVLWSVGERSVTPVLTGDRLYALLGERLAALDPGTGKVFWRSTPFYGKGTAAPALAPGPEPRIYVPGAKGRLFAFLPADGSVAATFTVERALASLEPYVRDGRTFSSSPVITQDFLIFGGNDGYLYVLDRRTLSLRQRIYLGAPVTASPAVSGNMVFVAALDGNVYAFLSAPGDR